MDIKTHRWGRINETKGEWIGNDYDPLYVNFWHLIDCSQGFFTVEFSFRAHLQSLNRVIGWIFAELMIIYIWEIERSRFLVCHGALKLFKAFCKCIRKRGGALQLSVNIYTRSRASLNPSALKFIARKLLFSLFIQIYLYYFEELIYFFIAIVIIIIVVVVHVGGLENWEWREKNK